MLNETFYIDGIDAKTVGINLQKSIEFSPAVPIVEKIHVPGRNGDLIFDTGAYENRTGTASCFALKSNVNSVVTAVSNFLLSNHGYRRLECSNDPDHFWKARISNGARIENRLNALNPFEIEFDCMPQRFLKSGEETLTITEKTILNNFYGGTSKPLIKIYRKPGVNSFSGLKIGESIIVGLFEDDDVLTFDSENQNVYSDSGNRNNKISIGNGFPIFKLGDNVINFNSAYIEKIEIVPRWWDK
jgi:phage-related protein